MALPVGVTRLGQFQGRKGDKGATGVLADLDVELLPWDADPYAEMTGPEDSRGATIGIPMPLPSASTVATDDVNEALIKTPTKTQKAVDGRLETGIPQRASLIAADVINNGPLARATAVQQARVSKRLSANRCMPNKQIILNGANAEAWLRVGTTVTADVDHVISGGKGWKVAVTAGGANQQAYIEPSPALAVHPSQVLYARLWVDDPTLVTNLSVSVRQATGSVTYVRSNTTAPAQPLVTGWNLFRWKMAEGLPVAWDGSSINRITLLLNTTGATFVTIGEIGFEWHQKAKMIFVLDRGYETFVTGGGVADLDALGIPITWAVDVLKIGDRPANPAFNAVTLDYLRERAAKGDSISFHGYTADPTANMTPAQVAEDQRLSVAWAKRNGFTGHLWRAAFVQDTATDAGAAAAAPYVLAQAQHSMPTFRLDSWPPRDMMNIARTPGMDGLTASYMDALKRTRGLMVLYQHGIQADYIHDATPAEWAAWRDALAAALTEGWLEATTFEDLYIDTQQAFA